MPNGSIAFARGISQVWTPEEFIPLRTHVREKHHASFRELQNAINDRFGTDGGRDDFVNVFYAAAEMALMEDVGRKQLRQDDRRMLRRLWEHLLHAR